MLMNIVYDILNWYTRTHYTRVSKKSLKGLSFNSTGLSDKISLLVRFPSRAKNGEFKLITNKSFFKVTYFDL